MNEAPKTETSRAGRVVIEEAPTFAGIGVCTWLLRNCWACRKEFGCDLSREIQEALVRGEDLRPEAAERVGLPPEPREDWSCLEREPRRGP